jgi:hypothetical protein
MYLDHLNIYACDMRTTGLAGVEEGDGGDVHRVGGRGGEGGARYSKEKRQGGRELGGERARAKGERSQEEWGPGQPDPGAQAAAGPAG